ncbi:hypothetical protein PVAND_008638 [Polypedilum vanderplanki]|uniref:AB hydrolase-1 domain-containing protein n=1 Tax=Polypedilum vanderplanki TaxID=319348 RepID=A0A9J6CAV3_POLVA|nr:hypothetical protein PVAND_008638 [Polypedilum vanderplanki]
MVNDKTVIEYEQLGREALFGLFVKWNSHSPEALASSEDKIFSKIKKPFRRYHVDIGKCVGKNDKIWTFEMNEKSENIPIVLLHGFGAGMAFWALNLEALGTNNPVYAFDILGLARSSRPIFSNDPAEIEEQFVLSIEKWREAMKIDKMILVAHSWGGFLASSYSLKYAERVEHLLLVDPWGLDEHPDMDNFPLWKLTVAYAVRLLDGCFTMIRVFGPFGDYLIKNVRPDLLQKYNSVCEPSVFSDYIYHCVNHWQPTGEVAFHKMTRVGPWPINPVGERLKELDKNLPLTFLYGSNSWTSKAYGYILKDHRKESYTEIKIIPEAGHHLYTDNSDEFHKAVLEASQILRSNLMKKDM